MIEAYHLISGYPEEWTKQNQSSNNTQNTIFGCHNGKGNHSNVKRAKPQGKSTSVADPTHEKLLP